MDGDDSDRLAGQVPDPTDANLSHALAMVAAELAESRAQNAHLQARLATRAPVAFPDLTSDDQLDLDIAEVLTARWESRTTPSEPSDMTPAGSGRTKTGGAEQHLEKDRRIAELEAKVEELEAENARLRRADHRLQG
jgi:hypothetical protein